jgi:hypothetical protein
MNRSSAYRRHAQDCIAMAELVTSEKTKSSLFGWARQLAKRAEEAELAEGAGQPEPSRGGAPDPSVSGA